jgi:hypothetical protein
MAAGAPPAGSREPARDGAASVELWWIPLGAGGHVVRWNGRVYEVLVCLRRRRRPRDLHHAALLVTVDGVRWAVEVAPSPDADEASRGVVASGPVGDRALGRLRLFRYEVRRWPGGTIPDLRWASVPPVVVSRDPARARAVLDALPAAPPLTWGRDEIRAGDMWNSNSVVAWALATAGLPAAGLHPPPGGRAPGWDAGVALASGAAAVPVPAPARP